MSKKARSGPTDDDLDENWVSEAIEDDGVGIEDDDGGDGPVRDSAGVCPRPEWVRVVFVAAYVF